MTAETVGSKHKELYKSLHHQNCKWLPVLSFLAGFTGKTGELRNGCFIHLLVEKLGVLILDIKLSTDAGGYNIHSFIHCVDYFPNPNPNIACSSDIQFARYKRL